MLELEKLTERIIGAAIEVHRALGPGFLESIYEAAMAVELSAREIAFRRQHQVPVRYRGELVGEHRLDLLVEEQVVVELKAARRFEDVHFAVVRSYLRSLGLRHGLLLNFSGVTVQAKRVIAP